jgi:hypothetical protein
MLACLLKEDDTYWVRYLVKAQRLLLHLVKFATKRGGVLAQNTFSNVPKMIDFCILATVIGIQTMAATTCTQEFQASLEMFKQVFSLLDYFLDSELKTPNQPFMDALIAHPKSYVLNDAILDGLKLILQHRMLLIPREDGKVNAAITRTVIAVFDVLDILAMSEEFVMKLLSKSQGYQLVETCLTIFKHHSKLGHHVLFATLKLLYRLCEEEATFMKGVMNSPACAQFNLVLSYVIDVASDTTPAPLTQSIRCEATKIIFAASRETSYRRLILEKATPLFLKFLSAPSADFAALFKDQTSSEMLIYIFATISFLHAQPILDTMNKSFCEHALHFIQTQPSSLLLKKAYAVDPKSPEVYAPSVVANLNSIINEILTQSKWRQDLSYKITKRHITLAISFRNELEKSLGLNSTFFDALIAEPLAAWSDHPLKSSNPTAPSTKGILKPTKPKVPP